MSWKEYKPDERSVQEIRDDFDKDGRKMNIMIFIAISLILGTVGYGIYFDEIQRNTIITLTSQLDECQLKSQPK